MSLKSLTKKVVSLVEKEPVAVWGVVAAAVLNAVAPLLHLHAGQIQAVATGLGLVGIPVVRSKVSPAQAVKAVVDGAKDAAPPAAK